MKNSSYFYNNNIINNKNNIFKSLTEIDDEEINLRDNINDDDEKTPIIVSVYQLLEKYIKYNYNYHLSVISLLQIILNNDDELNIIINNNNNNNNNDISLFFHKIFLPNHSHAHTISII